MASPSPPGRDDLPARLRASVEPFPAIGLALLFGSGARGELRADSDVDVAVAGREAMDGPTRVAVTEAIAEATGRPVDLVDLRTAGPVVRRQALERGLVLIDREPGLRGELHARLLADEADYLPHVRRIQRAQIARLARFTR